MVEQSSIHGLFRSEFSRIVAVLSKRFGLEHIEMAEDIASETFLTALESWPYKGMPENPVAWLHAVARNKAISQLARIRLFSDKIAPALKKTTQIQENDEIDLSDKNITDSQLQMLFAICHPSIPGESQVALALRILCGFGIDEIAVAFLTNKEVINKRLFRAREKLRQGQVAIEFPGEKEMVARLDTVLRTLYLLFSEGYYSQSNDMVIREDLCTEAMRLTRLLLEERQTNLPAVNALLALMCFHASRFKARKDRDGGIVLYEDQDESLWDQAMITSGGYHLHLAASGDSLGKYHLEACIAYWHTIKADTKEKWENILQLYNRLLQVEYSPIAALNRTFALSKARGKQEALREAEKLDLRGEMFYFILLGELYSDMDIEKAQHNFEQAYALAKTQTDKLTIRDKIKRL